MRNRSTVSHKNQVKACTILSEYKFGDNTPKKMPGIPKNLSFFSSTPYQPYERFYSHKFPIEIEIEKLTQWKPEAIKDRVLSTTSLITKKTAGGLVKRAIKKSGDVGRAVVKKIYLVSGAIDRMGIRCEQFC